MLLPTLFVETAAMGQHDGSAALSINIGVDFGSVLGGKATGFCAAVPRARTNAAIKAVIARAANVPSLI